MNGRLLHGVVCGAVVLAIACVDMSAPKGPASITALLLPSPSVVVGDTMRDSLGVATPLGIIAFDANGARITVDAQFFITDTGSAAHINSKNVVVGDRLGFIRVIGQIGGLQTPVATIPVTVAPTSVAPALPKIDTLKVPITGDSATSTASATLGVTLKGANDSTAQGFLVKYTLVRAPATKAGSASPAVYLSDGNRLSTVDTSDASGASRNLVVNALFLADQALVAGQKTDSAVVTASAFYKGAAVSGSPVRFVVPIRVTIK